MIMRFVRLAGACWLVSLALSPAAGARLTDRHGAFHACYNKKSGVLRLVKAGKRCRRGESGIAFSQNGQSGSPGRNGANGANGTNGLNGAAVAARARSIAPLTLSNSPQDDPLTGNTWTQQAGELDVLFGQVMVSNPTGCTDIVIAGPPPTSVPGSMSGEIDVDGNPVATFISFPGGVGPTPTPVSVTPAAIFEPTASTPHTVTVKAQDNCNSGTHFVLNSVSIDVMAAR